MKQWLYLGEPAKIGGNFEEAILYFKLQGVCDVKELNIYQDWQFQCG